jgi:hypothetical protein
LDGKGNVIKLQALAVEASRENRRIGEREDLDIPGPRPEIDADQRVLRPFKPASHLYAELRA